MRRKVLRWGLVGVVMCVGNAVVGDPIYVEGSGTTEGRAVESTVLPGTTTNLSERFVGDLPELSLESLLSPMAPVLKGVTPSTDAGVVGRLLLHANWRPELERLMVERQWDEAYRLAMQELRAKPADVRRIRLVAVLAGLAGHSEKAVELFDVYLRGVPDDVAFRCAYATVLLELNRPREAMAEVYRVLRQSPEYLRAHFLGLMLEAYRPGLADEALDPIPWDRLPAGSVVQVAAWLADDEKRFGRLLGDALWREVTEVMLGRDAAGQVELILQSMVDAEAAYRKSEWSQAGALYEQSIRYGVGSLSVMERLAEAMVKGGRQEEALAVMNSLVRREPGEPSFWFNRGYVLLDVERYEEAGISFAKSLRLAPQNGEAAFAVACAYAGQGRMDEAYGILASLLPRHPDRLGDWIAGDESYLRAMRADGRYEGLMQELVNSNSEKITP